MMSFPLTPLIHPPPLPPSGTQAHMLLPLIPNGQIFYPGFPTLAMLHAEDCVSDLSWALPTPSRVSSLGTPHH